MRQPKNDQDCQQSARKCKAIERRNSKPEKQGNQCTHARTTGDTKNIRIGQGITQQHLH